MAMANLKRCLPVPVVLGIACVAGCADDMTEPALARPSRGPEFVLLAPGTVAQVSAGSAHTCAVRTDGTVACWGRNDFGQTVPPAGAFTQVSGGWLHTCGLKTDSTVACWGDNYYGAAAPRRARSSR